MKKSLSLLIIALGMLLATACENEPQQVVSYINTPEMMAKVSEGLQGTYNGKLIVVTDFTQIPEEPFLNFWRPILGNFGKFLF